MLLEEIRQDFIKEMRLYLDNVDFENKTKLEENLFRIISTKAK